MSSNALLWPSQGTKPEERLDKYKWLKLPSQGFGGALVIDGLMEYEDFAPMAYEIDWIGGAFQQRIPLTINASQVPSAQLDFPLLINDTYPDLIGEVEAELRFAGTDNIKLPYEIQKFDNITGELIAWVKKPKVTDGDVTYIYFDNPGAVDAQDPGAVWDVNYSGVYHMNGVGTDSTANAQDLTINGTTTVSAKIGDGLNFAGLVTDFLIRNPFTGFPSIALSAEFWAETIAVGEGMVTYAVTGATNAFFTFNQNSMRISIGTSPIESGADFNDGVFHHIVVTWRSSDGQIIVYVDGVSVFSGTHETGTTIADGGAVVLGQEQDTVGGGFSGSQAYDGILDEVRYSDIARSADYVTTSFNNQSNPGAFFSTGTVELLPLATVSMGYEE